MEYEIVKLTDRPEMKDIAARWFHDKWGVPLEAYTESMDSCLSKGGPIPMWYMALENDRIVGGLGVIENDFHPRTDLTPNICAVYTEQDRRCRGIAGGLLERAVNDLKNSGINKAYLVTSHTSFYERYGWQYYCGVVCDGEDRISRVYVHN